MPDEESAVPGYAELKGADKWVHLNANILKIGREDYPVLPEGSPDQEKLDKMKEADAVLDRLRPISEDSNDKKLMIIIEYGTIESYWQKAVYGDEQQFNQQGKEGTTSYAALAFRPYRWPGAITVYQVLYLFLTIKQNGKWQSLYIGYGIQRGGDAFMPIGPPAVIGDPEDPNEQPEPNPLKMPEKIEEKKEEAKENPEPQ